MPSSPSTTAPDPASLLNIGESAESPMTSPLISRTQASQSSSADAAAEADAAADAERGTDAAAVTQGSLLIAPRRAASASSSTSFNAPTTSTNDLSRFHRTLRKLQVVAVVVAHFCAMMSVLLVLQWTHLLGGFSWKTGQAKLVFNWHPVLMVAAYSFMTVATFSFRFPVARMLRKSIHAVSWSVAMLGAAVALIAVFRSHNDRRSGLIANLYSLHSWIGMLVVGMYVVQFSFAVRAFAWPFRTPSPAFKARVLTVHKYIGSFVYICTGVVILLGLQEKEGFVGCSYKVSEPDVFPLQHLNDIPFPCRVSHAIGVCIVTMLLCSTFVFHNFGHEHTR